MTYITTALICLEEVFYGESKDMFLESVLPTSVVGVVPIDCKLVLVPFSPRMDWNGCYRE